MAGTLPLNQRLASGAANRGLARPAVQALRMVGAATIALALMAFVVGTAWDTQWHVAVGRDRTLTAPHVMMLGGIAVGGLASLALVLWESWLAWRGQPTESTRLLRLFRAPIGAAAAGSGALLATLAFPLDDYWHTLYGIDVTLWAPFHVMIVASVLMIGCGAMFVLAAELRANESGRRAWLEGLFILAAAATWSTLLLLLPQANADEGLFALGTRPMVWYPILLAGALPLLLLPLATVVKRPGAATLGALAVLGLRQAMFWFVPWAVETTRAAEGLVYRANPPSNVITPYAFPLSVLLVAALVDGAFWLLRNRPGNRLPAAAVSAVVLAGGFLAAWIERPWARSLTSYYYPDLDAQAALINSLPLVLAGGVAGLFLAWGLSRGLRAARH